MEEKLLGVEEEKTKEYREDLQIPGSDDVRVIEEEQRRRRSESTSNQAGPRKKMRK